MKHLAVRTEDKPLSDNRYIRHTFIKYSMGLKDEQDTIPIFTDFKTSKGT